ARLGPLGAHLAREVVEKIASGELLHVIKQDKGQVTKAPKLKKEHGLIDWTRPAEAICNQVRAMQPWPTAYTFLHQPNKPPLRLIVQKARVTTDAPGGSTEPGRLATDPSLSRLFVRAGQGGWVEVVELQPAGKRRMSAAEFLHGNALTPESRLGPEPGA